MPLRLLSFLTLKREKDVLYGSDPRRAKQNIRVKRRIGESSEIAIRWVIYKRYITRYVVFRSVYVEILTMAFHGN